MLENDGFAHPICYFQSKIPFLHIRFVVMCQKYHFAHPICCFQSKIPFLHIQLLFSVKNTVFAHPICCFVPKMPVFSELLLVIYLSIIHSSNICTFNIRRDFPPLLPLGEVNLILFLSTFSTIIKKSLKQSNNPLLAFI